MREVVVVSAVRDFSVFIEGDASVGFSDEEDLVMEGESGEGFFDSEECMKVFVWPDTTVGPDSEGLVCLVVDEVDEGVG